MNQELVQGLCSSGEFQNQVVSRILVDMCLFIRQQFHHTDWAVLQL